MIRIALCDDCKEMREMLKNILKVYFEEKDITYGLNLYDTGDEFLGSRNWEYEDILIIDIEMPGLSGVQVKNILQSQKSDTKILFLTSHEEMMQEAFGGNVYGFLVKPVKKEELFLYMDKICEALIDTVTIMLKTINGTSYLKENEIVYIQADKKYSSVITEKEKIFTVTSLGEWREKLPDWEFVLCHRSYIVNLWFVKYVDEDICLTNGKKLPLSRRKIQEVKEKYREFVYRRAR